MYYLIQVMNSLFRKQLRIKLFSGSVNYVRMLTKISVEVTSIYDFQILVYTSLLKFPFSICNPLKINDLISTDILILFKLFTAKICSNWWAILLSFAKPMTFFYEKNIISSKWALLKNCFRLDNFSLYQIFCNFLQQSWL